MQITALLSLLAGRAMAYTANDASNLELLVKVRRERNARSRVRSVHVCM